MRWNDSWHSLSRLTAEDGELIAEVFLYGGSWRCSLVDAKCYWTTRELAKGFVDRYLRELDRTLLPS